MIEFLHIEKIYPTDFWAKPVKALDDLSFKIKEGSLVGFLGPNGAGKTTAIKNLLRLSHFQKGKIHYNDKLGKKLERIGYIPERPYYYPHLTGGEFIRYMASLSDVPKTLIKERGEFWAKRLGIDFALNRKLRGYSKGMLQRLGFVSALIHDPLLLILDEPLSGLDPIGRKELKDTMLFLHKEGKTIFFSSHIVSDVEEICDKVIVLEKGKLFYEGSIEALIGAHIKSQYLGSIFLEETSSLPAKFLYKNVEGLSFFEILDTNKDAFIAEVLKRGGKLSSLQKMRPSLEEIIYKVHS